MNILHRFTHAEDAKRAIQELNGKKPPQFYKKIVVKLADYDIGGSRNRWTNEVGPRSNPTSNGNHFNQNMYQNDFNAQIGSINSLNTFNNYGGSGAMAQNNMSNNTHLPSVSSSTAFNHPSNNCMLHTLYISHINHPFSNMFYGVNRCEYE